MTNSIARCQTLFWVFTHLLVLSGCNPADTSLAPPPSAEENASADAFMGRGLSVTPAESRLASLLTGPYLASFLDLENGIQTIQTAADFVGDWPLIVVPPAHLMGRFSVVVYQDQDQDGQFNDCPYPPAINTEFDATAFDYIQGSATVTLPLKAQANIQLSARTCGLGNQETGIKARIQNLSTEPLSQLFLLAEPSSPEDADDALRTLVMPVYPGRIDAAAEMAFTIMELLPGSYDLTVFEDEDGDKRPSPCNDGLGGGDRLIDTIENIQVEYGKLLELDRSFQLSRRNCPLAQTGIRGTIILSDLLENSSDDSDELALLDGPLRIRLTPLENDSESLGWILDQGLEVRPFPFVFTLTGVPPDRYAVTFFIDRDENANYSPCDGLPKGLDAVWAPGGDLEFKENKIQELGTIRLSAKACAERALSGVRGRLIPPVLEGSANSGRAIRLALTSTASMQETESILLSDNHRNISDDGIEFTHELPPGEYIGRVYLDTDADGVFTHCSDDARGDQAFSSAIDIKIVPGQVLEMGLIPFIDNNCEPVNYPVNVTIEQTAFTTSTLEGTTRVLIEEAGGWSDDLMMELQPIGDIYRGSIQPLVNGRYRITFYVDKNGNAAFDSCLNGGDDEWSARAETVLDATNPSPELSMTPERACGTTPN